MASSTTPARFSTRVASPPSGSRSTCRITAYSMKSACSRAGRRRGRRRCAAGGGWSGPIARVVEGDEGDYGGCVLGLRDYVGKNGFPGVLLGVSGGIDSALCAAIAVDALGAERVRGVMLPFRFTAQVSLADAAKLARALGIRYEVLPIAQPMNSFTEILSGTFAGLP